MKILILVKLNIRLKKMVQKRQSHLKKSGQCEIFITTKSIKNCQNGQFTIFYIFNKNVNLSFIHILLQFCQHAQFKYIDAKGNYKNDIYTTSPFHLYSNSFS